MHDAVKITLAVRPFLVRHVTFVSLFITFALLLLIVLAITLFVTFVRVIVAIGFVAVIPIVLVDLIIGTAHFGELIAEVTRVIQHHHGYLEVVETTVGARRGRKKCNAGQSQNCHK